MEVGRVGGVLGEFFCSFLCVFLVIVVLFQ